MISKKSATVTIVICVILVSAALLLYHCNDESDESEVCNADVVAIKDFSVQDVKVGTYTNGSMIVQKTSEKLTIRVIGSLNVANGDFGGVCFYHDNDMKLSSVVTSYRDDPNGSGVLYATTFIDKPLGSWISFGREPVAESGDGVFEIVFEYKGDKPIDDIESILVGVAVGSCIDESGIRIVGTVHEDIEIQL